MVRGRAARVTVLAAAVVMGAALVGGCGPEKPALSASASASSSAPSVSSGSSAPASPPSPSPSGDATAEAESTPTARPYQRTEPSPTKKPAPERTARPAAPTGLRVSASTEGGRITLERGGTAQEFTVSVRNGNARAYPELYVALQTEIMRDSAGAPENNGLVLERRDPATGVWRRAELRVANDVFPHFLYPAGTPLPRDASRVERYRLRALPEAPTGSTPLMINLVDKTAPERATSDEAIPRRTSLMLTVTG